MRKHHDLKISPECFNEVLSGNKTFEIRYNDRNYKKGDTVLLQEYIVDVGHTGREMLFYISYLTSFAQKHGWVVFSIKELK